MTLQIRGHFIAQVPATRVRDALRVAVHTEPFNHLFIAAECKINERKARAVVKELCQKGYLESAKAPAHERRRIHWYAVTPTGMKFVHASAMPRLNRAAADKIVADFMRRVEEVNANPDYLLTVTSVVVYGSYVRGAEDLGDVDIAYELTRKVTDFEQFRSMGKQRVKIAQSKGRSFGGFVDELFWPEREVNLHLKARTRGLSIHGINDFIEMEKDEKFRYKVMLGDAEQIATRLLTADKERAKRNSEDSGTSV